MPPDAPLLSSACLDRLKALADQADASLAWPSASWAVLRDAGVLRWSIPRELGGASLPAGELLEGYEQLAGTCLTTAFILSQREAAVRRLLAHGGPGLQQQLVPALARGDSFATVGLSHLTTSRQHQAPIFRAEPLGEATEPQAFRLDGFIPWVTGADRADFVVIGATLPDGRQVLLALPTDAPGFHVEPPMPLMSLAGSRTSQVRCEEVKLGREWLLAGPAEKILSGSSGGVGGLETSCLALGLAGVAIDFLHEEAEHRPELAESARRFAAAREQARAQMHRLAEEGAEPNQIIDLRVGCTRLVLQATQVALTVAKGTGFVRPHPAQRWARQALFFLVWSCPRSAAETLIGEFLPGGASWPGTAE